MPSKSSTSTADLLRIERTLGRIEGTQQAILDNQKHIYKEHEALDTRVDTVEKRITYFTGIATAGASMITLGIKYVWDHLSSTGGNT